VFGGIENRIIKEDCGYDYRRCPERRIRNLRERLDKLPGLPNQNYWRKAE
jgi:hypothetical protein